MKFFTFQKLFGSDSPRSFFLRFLLNILVIGGISFFGIYYYYQQARSQAWESIQQQEFNNLQIRHNELLNEFSHITTDTFLISNAPALKKYLTDEGDERYQDLAVTLRNLSLFHPIYDQVRYIAADGMEEVRVNLVDGKPQLVAKQDLQNKADRPYFIDTMKLNQGTITISAMDLNMERGQIEIPFKATMRVATPVFDDSGQRRGIVVLNYLGSNLNAIMSSAIPNSSDDGNTLLLNQEAYYLYNPTDPTQEWGFLLEERNELKFSNDHPEAWQAMQTLDSGQIESTDCLVTFFALTPVEVLTFTENPSLRDKIASQPKWWLVSEYPYSKFNRSSASISTRYSSMSAIFFLMALILSLGIARITIELEQRRAQLEFSALHDSVTGLPNRILFMDRLSQVHARSLRDRSKFSVFFIDLDGFKNINDTLGHEAGDVLLRAIAEKISGLLRKTDTIARFGGDEFCILSVDINDGEDSEELAARILKAINQPFEYKGHPLKVTASIGISSNTGHQKDLETLINEADQAMYLSKNAGKNRYTKF
jgi:diguanylate cyclase (GGDEF)-like protein